MLGAAISTGLARAGASVVVLGRNLESATRCRDELVTHAVGDARMMTAVADVTNEEQLRAACYDVLGSMGRVDILVNAAGGNVPAARTDEQSVFDMPLDAFDEVVRLNLHGTVYPTLVFGSAMAEQRSGVVVNISSMASLLAISGVPGYAAAKAAVDNFTRWMAADVARRYGPGLRLNSIAPGFFVTKQNRSVLINPDGSYTERSKTILAQTPAGRFGEPEEIVGPAVWLCSDAASFVTGAVIPIDGGFSVWSGV